MRRILFSILILALVSFPVIAQTDIAVYGTRSHVDSTESGGFPISFDSGHGYGASINHFWGNHFSTEVAATWLRYDGRLALSPAVTADLGRLEILPITATAQWHFARGAQFDPYVGAGAAYVTAKDLSSDDLNTLGIGNVSVENRTTWLANAGVNIGLRGGLGILIDGKYIDYRPDSGPSGATVRLDLKPVVFSAGLRWRF